MEKVSTQIGFNFFFKSTVFVNKDLQNYTSVKRQWSVAEYFNFFVIIFLFHQFYDELLSMYNIY